MWNEARFSIFGQRKTAVRQLGCLSHLRLQTAMFVQFSARVLNLVSVIFIFSLRTKTKSRFINNLTFFDVCFFICLFSIMYINTSFLRV